MTGFIPLPPAVETALGLLSDHGHSGYCVGGCVRDALLGRIPADWDLASSADPEALANIFASYRRIEVGAKHGTITVIFSGQPLEITSYRTEGAYRDHRRPDRVSFTGDIFSDLRRRDFTVNAMAYHPNVGVLDPLGGKEDLKGQRLRCVGDPFRRFTEDPLRILRCVRFSGQLNFEIEKKTKEAAGILRGQLAYLSRERTQGELSKLLLSPYAAKSLSENTDILLQILPKEILSESCRTDRIGSIPDFRPLDTLPEKLPLRLAFLFCVLQDAKCLRSAFAQRPTQIQCLEKALQHLRYPKETIRSATALLSYCQSPLPFDAFFIKSLMGSHGASFFGDLLSLLSATLQTLPETEGRQKQQALSQASRMAQEFSDRDACLRLKQLAVKGSDLIRSGFPPGKQIGEILRDLLDQVLKDRLPNEVSALLHYAKKTYG